MTLDMLDWKQLEVGIYLHRWRPVLIIVPGELPFPAWFRDQVLRHDAEFWRECIWKHARESYSDVRDAGVEVSDVVIQEVTAYVV